MLKRTLFSQEHDHYRDAFNTKKNVSRNALASGSYDGGDKRGLRQRLMTKIRSSHFGPIHSRNFM